MKKIYLLFVLSHLISAPITSQQSTTGKYRPDDVSGGLPVRLARSQVMINNVPSYLWQHGCGPTALGMVIGYYDNIGFPDLLEGDADTQNRGVNDAIANDEHYNDYSLPIDYAPDLYPDKSDLGGAHVSNCIADFMETSWSSRSNRYGWSWSHMINASFESYIRYKNDKYLVSTAYEFFSESSWDVFKNEINNQRPVVLLVDSNGDGGTDHFVTGIGYNESDSTYAIYDTWDNNVHWYNWRRMSNTYGWGIYGFSILKVNSSDTSDVIDLELALSTPNNNPDIYAPFSIFLTIKNTGNMTATNVNVRFNRYEPLIPYVGGGEYSASQGYFLAYDKEIWHVGDLAPQSTATLKINLFPTTFVNLSFAAEVVAANEKDADSTPNNYFCCGVDTEDDASFLYVAAIRPSDRKVDLELSLSSPQPNPDIYTNFTIVAKLTNNRAFPATGIKVKIPFPNGLVYVGGNEYTTKKGFFVPYLGIDEWIIDNLAVGESAFIEINYFRLTGDSFNIYAQVTALNQPDFDSTPNNGICCTANEDDEAVLNFVPLSAFNVSTWTQSNKAERLTKGNSAIKVYPNPATSSIEIMFKSSLPTISYVISDLQGRQVYSGKIDSNTDRQQSIQLDISHLPSGMYHVLMQTGNKMENIRFIKEGM